MADRDRWSSALAWAVVALVHALIGVWLARPVTSPRAPADDDVALQVEYIRRTAVEKRVAGGRRSGSDHRPAHARAVAGAPAPMSPRAESADPLAGVRDLDLRLPEAPVVTTRRDHFERRAPLDANTTRFERAWVPAGDALVQARFRSKAVGTALGLFGGPSRRCSEVERRVRRPDCLPLHGEEDDDEAPRRSVD
ncbi:MAG TPA: hypothetical protein VIG88_09510 [Lysobacter sp.]